MKCQKQKDSLRKQLRTYKKLTNVKKQSSKKAATNVKLTKKTEKTVKFIDSEGKEVKENKKKP